MLLPKAQQQSHRKHHSKWVNNALNKQLRLPSNQAILEHHAIASEELNAHNTQQFHTVSSVQQGVASKYTALQAAELTKTTCTCIATKAVFSSSPRHGTVSTICSNSPLHGAVSTICSNSSVHCTVPTICRHIQTPVFHSDSPIRCIVQGKNTTSDISWKKNHTHTQTKKTPGT